MIKICPNEKNVEEKNNLSTKWYDIIYIALRYRLKGNVYLRCQGLN